MAYKVFTNGSVLNASEINENLMNQSVIVFSNSTTRAAALTAPVEGMLTWLEDVNRYENYNGTAWVALNNSAILQVVSVSKTDTFTSASTTLTNITGLAATITPSSTSSKILVLLDLAVDVSADLLVAGDVTRNGTQIGLGDTAGSRIRAGWIAAYATTNKAQTPSYSFLDSPSSTSALTYQARIRSNTGTIYLNRFSLDVDNTSYARSISTITLVEVAA